MILVPEKNCNQNCTHLVEEEDEVDCKGNKQGQQAHVIKIPGKVILGGINKPKKKKFYLSGSKVKWVKWAFLSAFINVSICKCD